MFNRGSPKSKIKINNPELKGGLNHFENWETSSERGGAFRVPF